MMASVKRLAKRIFMTLPFIGPYFKARFLNRKHRFRFWPFLEFALSPGRALYWECDKRSEVTGVGGILAGVSDAPGKNVPGCYFQGRSGIITGGYNYFAPNVCIVSENHDPYDLTRAIPSKPVVIGAYNWFGFGSVVLPGVQIGDHVIVGANSVVTKDVPSCCVVAGAPARVVKHLEAGRAVEYVDAFPAYGFIPVDSMAGRAMTLRRREILRHYERDVGPILSECLKREIEHG